MNQELLQNAEQFYKQKRRKSLWQKLVTAMAGVVVFCTTYALILPAITLEQKAFCSLEEHAHTDECYTQVLRGDLICSAERLGIHSHTEGCYDETGALVCGLADYVVHTHDQSCYDAAGNGICPLPEIRAHVHEISCYAPVETTPETEPSEPSAQTNHTHSEECYSLQKGDLQCTLEETEGHSHSGECYVVSEILLCAKTEGHVHGDSCWETPLTCTQSTEGHSHGDSCYSQTLLCTTEAGHVHGDGCVQIDLICENTEEGHSHEDACYVSTTICTIPENHVHSGDCYETIQACTLEEAAPHVHGEGCYAAEPNLICLEAENHVHEAACYESILNCQLAEAEAHIHSDECYLWNSVLSCGLEEKETATEPAPTQETVLPMTPELICTEPVAEVHIHTDSCFEMLTTDLTCMDTAENHTHTAQCYGIWEKICELEEHTHELTCYSDPDADVETAEIWERTFCHVTLTGDYRADLLAIAQTQLGYTESMKNYAVWEDGTTHGYTRYGDWYGSPHGDWCAMFVSFCLHYAEVEDMPLHWGVRPWIEKLTELELYHIAEEYDPQPGDLVFYDWEGDGLSDHVGIVYEILPATEEKSAQVKAIEGNSSNCVQYVYYDIDDPVLLGYSELPEKPEEENEEIVYYCGLEAHTHESICYDAEGNVLCILTEHTHTELCTAENTYICGLEAHNHNLTCYDADNNLICTLAEHSHTEDCVEKVAEYFCGLEEHVHEEACYDDAGELVCALTEHRHSEECLSTLSQTDRARVNYVVQLIDALPTYEEVEATLSAYEEADDWDGYERYFADVSYQAQCAYVQYEDLSDDLRKEVTNYSKLVDLEWLWSARTLEITEGIAVYQVNSYNNSGDTTLFYGGSADSYGISMDFNWWSAIVVDEAEDGTLYVSQVDTTGGTDKSAYVPSTDGGFVLLIWHNNIAATDLDVNVGDIVSADFDYTATKSYTGSSFGTITFASANFKSDKDNTNKLTIVNGANTRDLIEVNLYDYGDNINTPYNTDSKYPGFQQDFGSVNVGSSFGKFSSFNFGNNITSNLNAGHPDLTNAGGTINTTTNGANSPINNAVLKTLQDGYPALADGTSLAYLFHGASGYATKMNSQSINGLFQHNSTTGAYTFNSRENHAQFNPGSDTFTLYKQIITSNFMMYPFGNFLPFNDITKLSAQASTIDRDYLLEIADCAQYKQNAGYSSFNYIHDSYSKLLGNEYGTLATQLRQFVSLMDSNYGTDWDAYDAVNQYFSTAGLSASFSAASPTIRDGEPLMDYLYSIDYDEETNFFFGMDMSMTFIQPKNGLTGNDGQQPMVFYFTGDDDVWVYLDGALFLDLSGIHRHVGGKIDFVNGLISYENLDVGTGDVSSAVKTVTFEQAFREAYANDSDKLTTALATLNENGTFKDYSTHSFNFYYMERGAGSGVCRMNFNFPLLKRNSISVSKEVSSSVDILGDPDYKFQVLKADSDGTKTETSFIAANTSYTIYDAGDKVVGTGTTDENGVFTLKAGQRAEFTGIQENAGKYYVRELLEDTVLEQYGKVTVSGESTTTSNNVTVGSDTFTGMDSPVKDMSDGATAFRFTNNVDETKLGELNISKQLVEYPQTRDVKYFDIQVMLDGVKLPVGTKYLVGTTEKTVETEGIITIAADETATLSGILAGTPFTVQETSGSAEGYVVNYTDSGGYSITVNDGAASSIIKTSADVQLVVTNSEKGATVEIPGTKSLTTSDGTERTYTFRLTEVTDSTGQTPKKGGIANYTVDVPVTDTEQPFLFTISYASVDMTEEEQIFYYKITEDTAEDTLTNTTVYVAEVTVTKDENDALSASVTAMYKNGTAMTEADKTEDQWYADFTNTLVGDLTLRKTVSGGPTDAGFTFTITLDVGESGLTALPTSYPATFCQQDGTTVDATVSLNNDGQIVLTSFKHGETAVISGIPYGAKWTITETDADGYNVTTTVTVGETVTPGEGVDTAGSIIVGETKVDYTNAVLYELPETGGAGTNLCTLGGYLLTTVSMGFLLYNQKSAERRITPLSEIPLYLTKYKKPGGKRKI